MWKLAAGIAVRFQCVSEEKYGRNGPVRREKVS